jgi:arylsulfatase A-like enzyme
MNLLLNHRRAFGLLLIGYLVACAPAAPSGTPAPGSASATYALLPRLAEAELSSPAIEPRAVTVGAEQRAAIWAHAPSSIRFSGVPTARSAVLRFGIGIQAGGIPSDGVRFSVRVVTQDGESEIWSRDVVPADRPADRNWIDVEVPLGAYAKQAIGLAFQTSTRANHNADFSAWSLPAIEASEPLVNIASTIRRKVLTTRLDTAAITRLALPPDASLDLAAEVVHVGTDPPPTEAVRFQVFVDDRLLLDRAVPYVGRVSSFGELLSLAEYSGRAAVLRFEILIPEAERGKLRAHWLHASLLHAETTPRLSSGTKPNVLLIVVDTLRSDHLGSYGYQRQTSPLFDRLADESVLFEQAISSSSWTLPATASILTGLYPTQHGVADGRPLALELETLAERAQAAGMTTFGVSANPIVGKAEGFDQGHEQWVHLPWGRGSAVQDLVHQLLAENAPYRWFGYVHFIDPHDPYEAPEPFASHFDSGGSNRLADKAAFAAAVDAVNFGKGEADVDESDLTYLRAAYDGEILYWDTQLGRLLTALDGLGLRDETVVIVTSDHGEEFLEHGRLKHGPHLYEESIRVPLLVHAPGRLPPERVRAPVETRLLSALGSKLIAGQVPRSAAELETLLRPRRGVTFSHSTHGLIGPGLGRTPLMAVRDEHWKFIEYPQRGLRELYDLSADPTENRDLAENALGDVERYGELLARWLDATSADTPVGAGTENERILEKLRSLGYIQ